MSHISNARSKRKFSRPITVQVKPQNSSRTKSVRKRRAQNFNIDVESMLWWPGNVYWKDTEGIYLGCNEQQYASLGLASRKDWIDRTVYQHLPLDFAKQIDDIDNGIMQTGKGRCLVEGGPYYKGEISYFLSTKMPLRNNKGKVVGLFGMSLDIVAADLKSANQMLMNSGLPIEDFSIIRKPEPVTETNKQSPAGLSKREIECIYHLIRGMTAKQIAAELNLSSRTIEFYLERIKSKFGCKKKSDLIAKVLDQGF